MYSSKKPVKKSNPIFQHLDDISINKIELTPLDEERIKTYSEYMINRYVSMCDLYINVVNEINQYQVPKEIHHMYYSSILPKRKQFFKYVKKPKELNEHEKKCLTTYFEIGPRQLDEYLRLLNQEQINEIVSIYDNGKK